MTVLGLMPLTISTEVPEYLLELMNDKNKEICKLCSRSLDIVAVSTHIVYDCIYMYTTLTQHPSFISVAHNNCSKSLLVFVLSSIGV